MNSYVKEKDVSNNITIEKYSNDVENIPIEINLVELNPILAKKKVIINSFKNWFK